MELPMSARFTRQHLQAWLDDGRMAPHDPERMSEAMISLGFDLLVHASSDPEAALDRVDFVVDLFRRVLEPHTAPPDH